MLYLFERLSVRPHAGDGRPEAFDEAAAVLAQVQRIAAAGRRIGESVATVPWGLPAVTTIGESATVQLQDYARALAEAISRYEPRLRGVRVEVEARDDALGPYGLSISGCLPGDEQARTLRIAAPF